MLVHAKAPADGGENSNGKIINQAHRSIGVASKKQDEGDDGQRVAMMGEGD